MPIKEKQKVNKSKKKRQKVNIPEKKQKQEPKEFKAPGEFEPSVIRIGIPCRQSIQHYYAVGGNHTAFGIFKGIVTEISPTKGYLFTKLYIYFEDDGWDTCDTIETFEDHVWVYDDKAFRKAGIKKGDKVQFSAIAYAYHRKDGSEDYSLKSPQNIKRIKPYELPKKNEEISDAFLGSLVCETCMYAEQCYRTVCLAPDGWKESMIASLRNRFAQGEAKSSGC